MSDAYKVTSMATSSGMPTPPNPTPRTDATSGVDTPPETDLNAVSQVLAPIEEVLNEKIEAAMFPGAPTNTPLTYSPAPSAYKGGRSRGLTGITDRLTQLKVDHPSRYASPASSSPSVPASLAATQQEDQDDQDEIGSQDSGLAERATLPKIDPRTQEFVEKNSFTSSELPVSDPDNSGTSSTVVASIGDNTTAADGDVVMTTADELSPTKDPKDEDVVEKSNWAEEVMDCVDRALKQLEQLAEDQARTDPTRSVEEHFNVLINKVLSSEGRRIRVSVVGKE